MNRAAHFITQNGYGLAGFALALLSKTLEPLPGLLLLLLACVPFGIQILRVVARPAQNIHRATYPAPKPDAQVELLEIPAQHLPGLHVRTESPPPP